MSWEENKEFTDSKPQYQPDPPEPYSLWKKTWKYIAVGVVCFCFGLSITTCRANSIAERNRSLSAENRELKKAIENTPAETVLVPYTVPVPVATTSVKPSKEAAPVSDVPAVQSIEPSQAAAPKNDVLVLKGDDNSYLSNDYYDVTEVATLKNTINDTEMIHKVLAKKNVTISSTVLAYGDDNSVIGKSTDSIVLTEGQYNYFHYYFENDASNAGLEITANVKNDSIFTGTRNPNAVEMVQYNQSGHSLYITFQQNVDKLDSYAKFKLLFYKGDQIVHSDDGHFDIFAKNMNGKGSTDVAELWAYDIDYDRIEYIYEP